jgi:hypothetical protein
MIVHAGSDLQSDVNQDSPLDIPTFTIGVPDSDAVVVGPAKADTIFGAAILPETIRQDGYEGVVNAVIVHEQGHLIYGYRDVYSVTSGLPTVGYWCLMDVGNLLGNALTFPNGTAVYATGLLPPSVDPWQKRLIYPDVPAARFPAWGQEESLENSSEGFEVLQVPTFKVDASHGDLHAYGNPHYWLDPANVRPIGEAILDGMARVAPQHTAAFRANLDAYVTRIDGALRQWRERLAPFAGVQLVAFHNSWPYFEKRFGVRVVEFLEPKPGVPPTPTHVAALQELLGSGQVKAILMESYFDDRVPAMLSRTTGVPLVKVPILVGAAPGADDQLALFDTITRELATALAGK